MEKKKLIDFLERCIESLQHKINVLNERRLLLETANDEEFMLIKPISEYQIRKEYVQNIKKLKLAELDWDILNTEDKLYGYISQLEMTKNGEEKNNKSIKLG